MTKKISYFAAISLSLFCGLCCSGQEFTQDFEEPWPGGIGPNAGPPGGWGVYEGGTGAIVNWVQGPADSAVLPSYEGSHAAYLDKENVNDGMAEDWLVTPQFTTPQNAQVRFYSRLTTAPVNTNVYEVRISTGPSQEDLVQYEVLASWTETQINPVFDQYTEKVVDIPDAYFGELVYIALVMIHDNGDRWLVDNFSVVEKCLAPSGLEVPQETISSTYAGIVWAEATQAQQWEVEVVPENSDFSGVADITTDSSPATIEGLVAGSVYKVRIRALCLSGVWSDWTSPVLFQTEYDIPANDACAGAISLAVSPDVDCNNGIFGYVENATGSSQPNTCTGAADDDVWYSFIATADMHLIQISEVTGDNADLDHAVYESNCDDVSLRYCSAYHNSTAINLEPGQSYLVRVYSAAAVPQSTTFTICVGTPPPPPANDECPAAAVCPVNSSTECLLYVEGSVYSATASSEPNSCQGSDDDDVWFEFVATSASHKIQLFDIEGSALNLFHVVYHGADCNVMDQLYCSNPESSVATGLIVGQTYKVRVYTFTGNANQTTAFKLCISTPVAPPQNDECANAVPLEVNGDLLCVEVTSGTILSATASLEENTCVGSDDDDVWFRFVATQSAHSISLLDVEGSTTNLTHALYSGDDCSQLTQVFCSDDNNSTPTGLTEGQTYYVRVYSYTDWAGQDTTFQICIGTPPVPPANDNCTAATELNVNPGLECNTFSSGTLLAATASEEGNSCIGVDDDDVWFTFTATHTSHIITFDDIQGSTTDLFHTVYKGPSCSALEQLYCSDFNTSTASGLVQGEIYYVRVYSTTGTYGQDTTFSICVTTPPLPPANDDCSGALHAAVNPDDSCIETVPGTIHSATDSGVDTTCFGVTDDDVWFEFTATATMHRIQLNDIQGGTASLSHALYTGDSCSGLTLVYCKDGITSDAKYLDPGTTYLLQVYSYTDEPDQTSSFSLCITTPQQPILVDEDYTPEELVNDILIGSECAQVANIAWKTGLTGSEDSVNGLAYFNKGMSDFPIREGIILSTGAAMAASGPNSTLESQYAPGWGGDQQLYEYIDGLGIDPGLGGYTNTTSIEFEFVPLTGHMSFPFVFASEEYGYYQCDYSDAFAFFLTNTETGEVTNLAVLPGTDIPISVVTIRDDSNTDCEAANPEYFGQDNQAPNSDSAINFNGQTVLLTAESEVVPNTVYRIKLVIGDRNDPFLDSAVFIGPFNIGNLDLGNDLLVDDLTALCVGESYTISSGLDPSLYDIQWFRNDQALEGQTAPQLIVDQAGVYTIEAFFIPSSCSTSESITIEFYEPVEQVTGDPQDLVYCGPESEHEFDLSETEALILQDLNPNNYLLTYYLSEQNAVTATDPVAVTYLATTPETTLFVRIDDFLTGCFGVKSFKVLILDLAQDIIIEDTCSTGDYRLAVRVLDGSFDPATANYLWSGPDGFTATESIVSITSTGTYTVRVITSDGCTITKDFNVAEIPPCMIPKGISPNQDGFNDTFDLSGFNVVSLSVFNRYGQKVYGFEGAYIDQWRGQDQRGTLVPAGTYFYSFRRASGGEYSGWVYINY